jgi:hypothetical protein
LINKNKRISQKNEFQKSFWRENRYVFKKEKGVETQIQSIDEIRRLNDVVDWVNTIEAKKKSIVSADYFREFGMKFKGLYEEEYAKAKAGNGYEKLDFMKWLWNKAKTQEKKNLQAEVKKEKLSKDYEFDIERLHQHIVKKLGNKKENLDLSIPDRWFESNDSIIKAYEYFFGEKGVIRKEAKNGKKSNIFGNDVSAKDKDYLEVIEGRLILIQEAYTKKAEGGGLSFLEAKQDTLDRNKHLREGMVYNVLSGNISEIVKTFDNASKADKWKYAISAGIVAYGLFKLIQYGYKKFPKATMASIVLVAANTLSGCASKDKKTIAEHLLLDKEKPDKVTETILSQMDKTRKEGEEVIGDDSEEIRAMLNFGGVKIEELWKAYSTAKSQGNKKGLSQILTKRLKREDGKKQWIDPEVAYDVADGYFNHMGRKYFDSANETGYLAFLIEKNKKDGKGFEVRGKKYPYIPSNPDMQRLLGINFFLDRHCGSGRDNTFFAANWGETFSDAPEKYFLSIPDFAISEVGESFAWWTENKEEVYSWIKTQAIDYKEFVWDQGLMESWKILKPKLINLKNDPIGSIEYLGENIWKLTLKTGAKIQILAKKGFSEAEFITNNTIDFVKKQHKEIMDFWNANLLSWGEVDDYWMKPGEDGYEYFTSVMMDANKKMVKIYTNTKTKTKNIATDVCDWTVEIAGEGKKVITGTLKYVVDRIKRYTGFETLSNITFENLPEVDSGIEAGSAKSIKDEVKKMAGNKYMQDIFAPLFPIMKEADEDVAHWYFLWLDSLKMPFEALLTGGADPVNENQWGTLVAYKENEMLLSYQRLLENEAKNNGGKITATQIQTIKNSFEKNLKDILGDNRWFTDSDYVDTFRDSKDGEFDKEKYLKFRTELLKIGVKNKHYNKNLENLVTRLEKEDIFGRNDSKYANQLRALALWKFAEKTALLSKVKDKDLKQSYKDYLDYVAGELIIQLETTKGIIFDSKTPDDIKQIFQNKMDVLDFDEYEKCDTLTKLAPNFFLREMKRLITKYAIGLNTRSSIGDAAFVVSTNIGEVGFERVKSKTPRGGNVTKKFLIKIKNANDGFEIYDNATLPPKLIKDKIRLKNLEKELDTLS